MLSSKAAQPNECAELALILAAVRFQDDRPLLAWTCVPGRKRGKGASWVCPL